MLRPSIVLGALVTGALAAPIISSSDPRVTYADCATRVPASLKSVIPSTVVFPPTFACGTLTAPRDWTYPSGPTISVGFTINQRDVNPEGVLFYNPGGPGVEVVNSGFLMGLDRPQPFLPDLTPFRQFAVVNMDTRGMFSSSPLNCSTEAFYAMNTSLPLSLADFQDRQKTADALAQSCLAGSGNVTDTSLFGSYGADSIARDMDLLRSILGFKTMHYLGSSYGTVIGQQLVKLFPDTIDRLVLDSCYAAGMSPEMTHSTSIIAQNRALDAADAICQVDSTCPLAKAGKGSLQKAFMRVVQAAQAGQFAAQNVSADFIRTLLAFGSGNPQRNQLAGVLALATTGNVSTFQIPSPFALGAIPASLVTFCHDLGIEDASYPIFAKMRAEVEARKEDRYGALNTIASVYQTTCANWPQPRGEQGVVPIDKPYLLVTSDYDSNTPTEWTTFLWQHSPRAVLAVRRGEGHPTYTWQNLAHNPARDAIISYLTTGNLPSPADDVYHTIFAADANRDTGRATIPDPYNMTVQLFAPTTGQAIGEPISPSGSTAAASAVQSVTGSASRIDTALSLGALAAVAALSIFA